MLIYLLYFLILSQIGSLFSLVPGLAETIELFVGVYIVLMIMGDLTAGTAFQHVFGMARALFTVGWLVYAAGDGVFSVPFDNFYLSVNLTLFYAIAAALSLLGVATAVLRAISFMSERAESGIKP